MFPETNLLNVTMGMGQNMSNICLENMSNFQSQGATNVYFQGSRYIIFEPSPWVNYNDLNDLTIDDDG